MIRDIPLPGMPVPKRRLVAPKPPVDTGPHIRRISSRRYRPCDECLLQARADETKPSIISPARFVYAVGPLKLYLCASHLEDVRLVTKHGRRHG